MTMPRMSMDALAAQALLEPSRLIVLVEGLSDRIVLEYVADKEAMAVDVYVVDDFEVADIRKYSAYGGNKARVASLISSLKDVSDVNIIGIVDLDNDEILGKEIYVKGLYYTKYCCLLSTIFKNEVILKLIWMITQRKAQNADLFNISCVVRCLFIVRALRDLINPRIALPKIKRFVGRSFQFGFDFEAYFALVANDLGSSFTSHDLYEIVKSYFNEEIDMRSRMHLHTAVEFICNYVKEFRLSNRIIEHNEIYAELRLLYASDFAECHTIELIKIKAAALV